MKCKSCKNEIPDGSIFCNWCGERQIRERKKRDEVKVPKPRQLPSGKWFIQLRAEGQSVTEETEALCVAKAQAIRAGFVKTKKKPVEDVILADAITMYIESKRNRLQARSIEQYEYVRDKRFETLMQKKISKITKRDIDIAIEMELTKPSRKGGTLSAKTVNDAFALVSTVLRTYIPSFESGNKPIEIQRSFPVILPPEDVCRAVKGTDIELPCMLSMWLSLSMSEIRGLTKSKSIRNGKLYIVETVVDVKGQPIRKPGGKEENRPRVYDIPPYIQKLIDATEGDILEPRSSHAIYMRFQRVLQDAGLPKMRFHGLRHINASVMAEIGIPTNIAQERGGWKTDSTMKKVYTHTFDRARKQADETINKYFSEIIGSENC